MNKIVEKLKAVISKINAASEYQQSFVEMLENKNVKGAISMLECHSGTAEQNLLNYNASSHKVMYREKKAIYNKKGDFLRNKDVNRIAIPYQKFINEVALVFLYGRPVIWSNSTPNPRAKERAQLQEQLDNAETENRQEIENAIKEIDNYSEQLDIKFDKLKKQLADCRFNALIREAKRYAGCEGCSAMLFHTYQEDGEPKMLIRVLAKSKNDDIYTLFDQYNRLTAFAWGYTTLGTGKESIQHYDIYTKDRIYFCKNINGSKWEIDEKPNLVSKIPVIVFQQEVEWDGVQSVIERIEDAYSKNADTNDNFGDPALVATSEIVNTLPKQEEESKLYILKNGGDIKYLERSSTNESRQTEIDALDEQVMSKTFTPNITIEELKGLSNASGTTLRQVMLLATIKADKRKESHDNYLSRISSLMKAIMGNVLDKKSGSYDQLVISHEFQEPFVSDIASVLDSAIKQFNVGALSMQTLLEISHLVPNSEKEMERIKKEQAAEDERRKNNSVMDVFGSAM